MTEPKVGDILIPAEEAHLWRRIAATPDRADLRTAAERVVDADLRAQSDDPDVAEDGEHDMSDALDALRAALATPEIGSASAEPERSDSGIDVERLAEALHESDLMRRYSEYADDDTDAGTHAVHRMGRHHRPRVRPPLHPEYGDER